MCHNLSKDYPRALNSRVCGIFAAICSPVQSSRQRHFFRSSKGGFATQKPFLTANNWNTSLWFNRKCSYTVSILATSSASGSRFLFPPLLIAYRSLQIGSKGIETRATKTFRSPSAISSQKGLCWRQQKKLYRLPSFFKLYIEITIAKKIVCSSCIL